MSPLLVTIAGASCLTRAKTSSERLYLALERTTGVSRSTVSRLWLKICGSAAITTSRQSSLAWKSGVSTSMLMSGPTARIARIVCAKCSAPPSLRSSRATAVTTTCLRRIRFTASATRWGSSASSGNGLAVVTAQNPQARVQRSPAIMKVAVPWLQHSHRLGHCASSQTVCSLRSDTSALVEKNTGFDGNRTRIQSGFRAWCKAGSILVQDIPPP